MFAALVAPAIYAYDTKPAAHPLQLGSQGIELLTDGHMNLPMLDEHRAHLRAVRHDEVARKCSPTSPVDPRL